MITLPLRWRLFRALCCRFAFTAALLPIARAQTAGQRLPPWSPGSLDIHRISTGQGDAVLYIFPDGTTLLADPAATPSPGRQYTLPRPDGSRKPGEWVARYVSHVVPDIARTGLDYAFISHFHGDHMGAYFANGRVAEGGYKASGISDVGDRIPIRTMIDRGWPDYDFPRGISRAIPEAQRLMLAEYRKFLAWQIEHRGMRAERFRAGRNDQIVLKRAPGRYPAFEIRNICANGEIWTGEGTSTRPLFPGLDDVPADQLSAFENMCSLVFRLQYGKFRYYVGGDIPGVVPPGKPAWYDVETPVAQVVGPVDVAVLNHHGVRDAANAFFIGALQPRVWLVSYWSQSHLHRAVLQRLLSPAIHPGPRDIFSTNMLEPMEALNPDIAQLKSLHGHIVIRVAPGGAAYHVIIVDDTAETFTITAVHGPYASR